MLALLAAAFAMTGRLSSAGAATSVTRQDSFESGGLSAGRWITKGATVQRTTAHDDRWFAHLQSSGAGAYLTWQPPVVEPGHRAWSARAWFRVDAHGAGESVGILSIKDNLGVHNADLFTDASTGHCRVDLVASDSASTAFACDDHAWHLVEMRGDYGSSTYTVDWRVDGVAQPSIRSVGQGATSVSALWAGDATPDKSNALDVDDVRLTVADTTPPFAGNATSYP